jgi:hypothetical protein
MTAPPSPKLLALMEGTGYRPVEGSPYQGWRLLGWVLAAWLVLRRVMHTYLVLRRVTYLPAGAAACRPDTSRRHCCRLPFSPLLVTSWFVAVAILHWGSGARCRYRHLSALGRPRIKRRQLQTLHVATNTRTSSNPATYKVTNTSNDFYSPDHRQPSASPGLNGEECSTPNLTYDYQVQYHCPLARSE